MDEYYETEYRRVRGLLRDVNRSIEITGKAREEVRTELREGIKQITDILWDMYNENGKEDMMGFICYLYTLEGRSLHKVEGVG